METSWITSRSRPSRINGPIPAVIDEEVRKTKNGYTLVEVLVVMAIILILSSIGIFVYQRGIAYAKEVVCKGNLRALKGAIGFYISENDALPATLGDLKLEHLEKAYAKAMNNRGWVTKFSYLLIKLNTADEAHAQFLRYENLKNYGVTKDLFQGPADYNGGVSYGINGDLEGRKWSDVGDDEIVIADSDNYVFNTLDQLAKRHNQKAFAIKKNNEIIEVDANGIVTDKITGKKTGKKKGKKIVCHKPGTRAQKTMTIPASEEAGHLGHGDTNGPC